MTMWKVIVSPEENRNAWDDFLRQGIIGIGWCNPREDNHQSVQNFMKIKKGDMVVAHLSSKRSGITYLAVGIGRITSDYHEVVVNNPIEWDGSFRRQFNIDWITAERIRLPNHFRTCNYRMAVSSLDDGVALDIMNIYGLTNYNLG